jgi:hypothetical protein
MGRLGASCGIMAPQGAFAASSRFAEDVFPLPKLANYLPVGLFFGPRFGRITRDWRPDLIVPLDDLAARVLREERLARSAGSQFRALIERSLGASEHFGAACTRQGLAQVAERLGVRTPSERPVESVAEAISAAAAIGYPVVLKREQTCGGVGVTIVQNEQELADAFRRISFRARAKRWLSFVPGFQMPNATSLTLQHFVQGSLSFRAVACADGVVLDGVSFLAECRNPSDTGASTVLRTIEHDEMAKTSQAIVAALRCSGFVAFDFILNSEDEAFLIEMNARPIASGHLGRLTGHDIYAAMEAHLRRIEYRPPKVADPPRSIALFPRELDRDPASPILDGAPGVLHDVPWDDPSLVETYAAWLERRHPSDRALIRRHLDFRRELDAARHGSASIESAAL